MDIPERVQQRTTKMIKVLENLSYEEGWESWDYLTQRREGLGDLINVYKYLKRGCSQALFSGTQRQWAQTEIGRSVWTLGNAFLLWGWPSTGTSCLERLWSLPPSTYSETIWAGSRATISRWPCLCSGGWRRHPFQWQSFCDTMILWKTPPLQWGQDVTFCPGANGIQLTFLCCKNYLHPLLKDNFLVCPRHEREIIDLLRVQWEVISAITASWVRVPKKVWSWWHTRLQRTDISNLTSWRK